MIKISYLVPPVKPVIGNYSNPYPQEQGLSQPTQEAPTQATQTQEPLSPTPKAAPTPRMPDLSHDSSSQVDVLKDRAQPVQNNSVDTYKKIVQNFKPKEHQQDVVG